MKCPECGNRTKNAVQIKDGGPKIPELCFECRIREQERTHEIIANLSLECGQRGLPKKESK